MSIPKYELNRRPLNVAAEQNYDPQSTNAMSGLAVAQALAAAGIAQEIIYDDLVSLSNNGRLVPGRWYRIVDYECFTTQSETSSAGHRFDIIVRADSATGLNENAFAAQNSGTDYFEKSKLEAWALKYCLGNDEGRFLWADKNNGKGVIYYMRDEFGNECPYDFKNIMFKRFRLIGTGAHAGINGFFSANAFPGAKINEGTIYNVHTFCFFPDSDGKTTDATVIGTHGDYIVHDNTLKPFFIGGTMALPNNVLIAEGHDISECTLFKGNYFGVNCHGNTAGDGCNDNIFMNGCHNNTLGDVSYGNTFGAGCNCIAMETGKYIKISNGVEYVYVSINNLAGGRILGGTAGNGNAMLDIMFGASDAELFAGIDNKGDLHIWNPAHIGLVGS